MTGVDRNGPKRFSVQRKMAIVARLLRGEPLELVARETNVSIGRLSEWRERALIAQGRDKHLQALLKTVGCCLNLGLVSFDIHIAGICEQCDCVGGRERLMQQLHALWSQDTEKNAHTIKVTRGSTESVDEADLDRIGAGYEDNGNRFGRCLRSKCRWEVSGKNCSHISARQFGRKGR